MTIWLRSLQASEILRLVGNLSRNPHVDTRCVSHSYDWVNDHGDPTSLVCLPALAEARSDLDRARRKFAEAALSLAVCRERLDEVVDRAFEQRKFGPIEAFFQEEEAARTAYEWAAKRLASSEARWFALRAALANEQALAALGPVPRHQLN